MLFILNQIISLSRRHTTQKHLNISETLYCKGFEANMKNKKGLAFPKKNTVIISRRLHTAALF